MIKFDSRFILLSCALLCNSAHALEMLPDVELEKATGQDGLTVGLDLGVNGAITFDHVFIEDQDGIPHNDYNQSGGVAYVLENPNTGIQFWAGNSLIREPFSLVVDADGNAGNPLMNIGILFDPNLSRIKLQQFSLALVRSAPSAPGTIHTISKRNLLTTGQDGVDILFNTGNPLALNVQLGNSPQGALMMFTGGSIQRIKTDQPIQIQSYAGCVSNAACSPSSSLKFGFDLKANNMNNGIRLAGIGFNTTNNGLEIRKATPLDSFDLQLSNITMGAQNGVNGATFQGLPNAAIGTIGLENVRVSGLEMSIKGF